jgi:hypothetical protein
MKKEKRIDNTPHCPICNPMEDESQTTHQNIKICKKCGKELMKKVENFTKKEENEKVY